MILWDNYEEFNGYLENVEKNTKTLITKHDLSWYTFVMLQRLYLWICKWVCSFLPGCETIERNCMAEKAGLNVFKSSAKMTEIHNDPPWFSPWNTCDCLKVIIYVNETL